MSIVCKGCNEIKPIENKDKGLCASCNRADRKNADADLYPIVRKKYLEMCERVGSVCPIKGTPITIDSDIHHKKGRVGYADLSKKASDISLLIDVDYFLAVSREGHQYIETHPKHAKIAGHSLTRMDVILK